MWPVARCIIEGVTFIVGIAPQRGAGPWLFTVRLAPSEGGDWLKTGFFNYRTQAEALADLEHLRPWPDFKWIDDRAERIAQRAAEKKWSKE
jgi:hypothetical protein